MGLLSSSSWGMRSGSVTRVHSAGGARLRGFAVLPAAASSHSGAGARGGVPATGLSGAACHAA